MPQEQIPTLLDVEALAVSERVWHVTAKLWKPNEVQTMQQMCPQLAGNLTAMGATLSPILIMFQQAFEIFKKGTCPRNTIVKHQTKWRWGPNSSARQLKGNWLLFSFRRQMFPTIPYQISWEISWVVTISVRALRKARLFPGSNALSVIEHYTMTGVSKGQGISLLHVKCSLRLFLEPSRLRQWKDQNVVSHFSSTELLHCQPIVLSARLKSPLSFCSSDRSA